jgi:cystathionine beta-lyase
MADNTILCTAPSKSFNLAGLQVSNIFIPGESLRAAFREQLDQMAFHEPNQLGLVACKTAYANAEEWLTGCKEYMLENLSYVRTFLAEKLPEIKLVEPEGTYFAWLDCTGLGLSKEQLDDMLIHKAKLWLDPGSIFGDCAALFQRMVLACPRATVIEAMDRLYKAIKG